MNYTEKTEPLSTQRNRKFLRTQRLSLLCVIQKPGKEQNLDEKADILLKIISELIISSGKAQNVLISLMALANLGVQLNLWGYVLDRERLRLRYRFPICSVNGNANANVHEKDVNPTLLITPLTSN